LKNRLVHLQQEEAKLGRMVVVGKLSDETYDQLREEWREKVRTIKIHIKELEFEASKYLDNLELPLF